MGRWLPSRMAWALVFALISGCEHQVFLAEKDLNSATNLLTNQLEKDPQAGMMPLLAKTDTPPVVDFPDRPARHLSLSEAIAIALENGTASSNFLGPDGAGGGQADNTLVTGNRGGQFALQVDRIRVLAYNPAIAFNNIEASESRFDAKWITTMNWTNTDNLNNGLNNFSNGQSAAFNSSIVKAFATGGVANMTFNTNYTNLVNPPTIGTFKVINPLYSAPVNIGIEQPLLRDFGVGMNQLLNQIAPIQGVTMPLQAANYYNNSRIALTQGPNFTGLPVQGILLARLSFDQARAEFERQIHNLLLNTEIAYWKLYQAYGNLYSYEEVLRLAHKAWWIGKANFDAGRLSPQDFYPIRAQYEEFRGERMKALGGVLEAERQLRGIIGLKVEDGTRIVPVTAPTLARYQPNWKAAQEDALALRPELILARQNLKNAQFNLRIQQNFIKPDLRFVGQYTPQGFGTSLDGRGTFLDGTGALRTANAYGSLAGGNFDNWTMGLTLNVPLGYRLEYAALRSARLGLAQSYYLLEDQEERAVRTLALHYQKLDEWYRRIEVARAERQAYGESVKSYWELYKAGTSGTKGTPFTTLILSMLDYQRRLALAQLKEFEAVSEYNNTLVRFEWAKGSIVEHDNVTISEGPLPQCVQNRAVENERLRTRALVLNERPQPLTMPGMLAGDNRNLPTDLTSSQPGPEPMSFDEKTGSTPLSPGTQQGNGAAPTPGPENKNQSPNPVPIITDKNDPASSINPMSSDGIISLPPTGVTPSSPGPSDSPGVLPGNTTPAEDAKTPGPPLPTLETSGGPFLPLNPTPTANPQAPPLPSGLSPGPGLVPSWPR